ncbi:DUF4476 domain-containing protein [Niabella pedocola]|uniref:DUF4476 domain-containing protein n=1 Tax=Niabella pedocola TaxID=1752077 RepID=A0ABS8PY19_9BACT|nr:DUF4476 domain-containing protein [Niabella pedocola]MCD2425973.1 DUF4476 domain-containing protein [Niabella pedocola]
MNKRLLLAIVFLLTGFVSFAQYSVQSKYFVYLQTEPAQPFYIKINGQRIEANSSGYLILPQLKDGDYRLVVGFQDNKSPEMTFRFKIDSKDKGYLIKNFGTEGWSLFDLQSMDVQKPLTAEEAAALAKAEAPKPQPRREAPKPQPKPEEKPVVKEEAPKQEPVATAAVQTPPPAQQQPVAENANVSDFTKILSKAANDPSLLEKPKPEEKPVVKEEAPREQVAAETPQPAPNNAPKTGKNAVVKLSQHSSGTGTVVVYEDRSNGAAEQIEITIPAAETTEEKTPESPKETAEKPVPAAKNDQQFAVQEKPAVPQEKAAVHKKEVKEEPKAASGNCKSVATESDFLKLRRDMAGKDNDDLMIEEARRAFKSKCYTAAQVKYISSMFLSNAGKYNFFEASRTHISDPENFSTLQSELKDTYYKEKFNSLIK